MSASSTSLVKDSSAVDSVVPHGASHRPRESWELGSRSPPPLVRDSSAVDSVVPHGASHRPREGQELVPVLPSISGFLIDLEMCLPRPKGMYYQLVFICLSNDLEFGGRRAFDLDKLRTTIQVRIQA
jgi:hypothetical protein